jgi:hypothetical protein
MKLPYSADPLKRARQKLTAMIWLANDQKLPPEKRRAARALARSALALVKLRERDAEWRAGQTRENNGDV